MAADLECTSDASTVYKSFLMEAGKVSKQRFY